eukprot:75575-Prymnesium_polylepis.1
MLDAGPGIRAVNVEFSARFAAASRQTKCGGRCAGKRHACRRGRVRHACSQGTDLRAGRR